MCISSSHDCIGQRFRKQINTSYDANNLVIVIDDTEETETEGTEQTVRSLFLFDTEKCSVVSDREKTTMSIMPCKQTLPG
jgi:hypothetical protein